jgi:hypothetical protein
MSPSLTTKLLQLQPFSINAWKPRASHLPLIREIVRKRLQYLLFLHAIQRITQVVRITVLNAHLYGPPRMVKSMDNFLSEL